MIKVGNAAVAAALSAVLLLAAACGDEGGRVEEQEPPPPDVSYRVIRHEPFTLSFPVSGRLEASRKVEVRPEASGLLEERLFREGSHVGKGDLLYRIRSDSHAAALQAAEADLEMARAALENRKSLYERRRRLRERAAVSEQDYEDARSAVSQGEARVLAAEAGRDLAAIALEDTALRAPLSGIISETSFHEGSLLAAGQGDPLAVIRRIDPLYIYFTLDVGSHLEAQARLAEGELSTGEEHPRILLDLPGGGTASGPIDYRDAAIDEATDSLLLRARLANPSGELLPGMFLRGRIEYGETERAIAIPQRAVSFTPGGEAFVWLLDGESHSSRRSLSLSRDHSGRWLVSEGLEAGERLIVDGTAELREGLAVSASPLE